MSDPTGWAAPKTDWLPADGIAHTDLNRMEINTLGIRDWLKQGGSFDVVTIGLPGGEKTGTVYWEKHAQGIVVLKLPELLGTTDIGVDTDLSLDPVVAWPNEILVAFNELYYPIQMMINAAAAPPATFVKRNMHGAMELPYEATTVVKILIFGQAATTIPRNCGIYEQYVTYFTTDSVFGTSTTTSTTPAP